ncbi:2OG-Fe(II) oxygenase [Micromonospora echinofusca]|uniref:2OG-Fe(II) oxygenase n=1 Tax=Micromonospora echinofusca TaxID=47858 RepID=UPI0033DE4631
MLCAAAFTARAVRDTPFRWASLAPTFADPAVARTLAATFPAGLLESAERTDGSGDKQYVMRSLTVMRDSRWLTEPGDLPGSWPGLVTELAGDAYRDAVARMVDVDLSSCRVEIRLCAYPTDGWLSAHTDRPDKIVTQVFYLNEEWDAGWGGALRLLSSANDDDVHTVVPPLLDTSVVFVRSDDSWHSVAPVHRDGTAERRSVLVHFSSPEP